MAKKLKKTKAMTPEMAAAYIANEGLNCPFCKDTNLTGDGFDVEGTIAAQEISCERCNKQWIDGWRRISVTHGGVIYEPAGEVEKLKERLKHARTESLWELFRKLRATNHIEVSDVMRDIASFIAQEQKKEDIALKSEGLEECHNGLIPEMKHDTSPLCSNCDDVLWAECQFKKRTRESADV
jgi:hypothetical protein